ncbi:MAG: response regulator [Candidatus Heimdallarchaeaceae archaeon]
MKKIYIIEDEFDVSNLYRMLFEREGIPVKRIVSNGVDALEDINKMSDELEDIVFLIDNRIPEETGLNIAKSLIELDPRMKDQIIIATADDTVTLDDIKALGIKHFLRKPFALEKLLEKIEEIQKSE